jgi:hypothetical protein
MGVALGEFTYETLFQEKSDIIDSFVVSIEGFDTQVFVDPGKSFFLSVVFHGDQHPITSGYGKTEETVKYPINVMNDNFNFI